jgi:ferric-dicitrate binding protein FerR (iron transport regulator)
MALKMRQSSSEWEKAFAQESRLDRRRRESLRLAAEQRTLRRQVQRRKKRGSVRFTLLVLTLILTAVVVTAAMFRTLYLLLG